MGGDWKEDGYLFKQYLVTTYSRSLNMRCGLLTGVSYYSLSMINYIQYTSATSRYLGYVYDYKS